MIIDIPLVDISDCEFFESHQIEQVLNSLSTFGFIRLISNDILSLDDINEIFQIQEQFFQQPDIIKLEAVNSQDSARRGYSRSGTENFGALIGNNSPNDLVEKYRIGPLLSLKSLNFDDLSEEDAKYFSSHEAKMHYSENEWGKVSNEINSFEMKSKILYSKMEKLSKRILSLLEAAFQLEQNYFNSRMNYHTSILTYNYFPLITELSSTSTEVCRIAEHTDVSMFTIVIQSPPVNESGGVACSKLQIKVPNSTENGYEWSDIPFCPGSVVVNIGECLEYWSNSVLKSTAHRVVDVNAIPSFLTDRLSIAYFVSPNYDAKLSPLSLNFRSDSSCASNNEGEVLSYSMWRKKHIQKTMKIIKMNKRK